MVCGLSLALLGQLVFGAVAKRFVVGVTRVAQVGVTRMNVGGDGLLRGVAVTVEVLNCQHE